MLGKYVVSYLIYGVENFVNRNGVIQINQLLIPVDKRSAQKYGFYLQIIFGYYDKGI